MTTPTRLKAIAKHMAQSDYGINWSDILETYAGRDQVKQRNVAMATLRVSGNWTYDQIGQAFGIDRGHAWRLVNDVMMETRIAALETALDEQLRKA